MIACRTAETPGTPKGLLPATFEPDPAMWSLTPFAVVPACSGTKRLHIQARCPPISAADPAIVTALPGPVVIVAALRWWGYAFATQRRRWSERIVIPQHLGLSRGDSKGQNQSACGGAKHFLHPIDLLLELPELDVICDLLVVVRLQRICTSSEADPCEEPGVTEEFCGARQWSM